MKLSDFLDIDQNDCRVHFASGTNKDNVLDLYFNDEFQEYQSFQSSNVFGTKYIISLIGDSDNSKYLFVGVYEVLGIEPNEGQFNSRFCQKNEMKYHTELISDFDHLLGRLVVKPSKKVGISYIRRGEAIIDDLQVVEYKSKKASYREFEGFNKVNLSRSMLENIIKTNNDSWKGGLSSMKGVYLITDIENNKLYVGSAYGQQGFWGRWSEYASSFHGGVKKLRALMKTDQTAFNHFKYSILEVYDHKTPNNEIIICETLWKERLRSKYVGYNDN